MRNRSMAYQSCFSQTGRICSSTVCEVHSMIRFLNGQNIVPIKIHRQVCQVNGPEIMSKQMVHRWCRLFSHGHQ
ncbi:hypothetical protein C0J52_06552 [Blattella germanica]|nr:hypothetical protein C0J52_06552 [Blattella germanica]